MPKVFIGLPHNGVLVPEAIEGLVLATSYESNFTIRTEGGSLLCFGFNRSWVTALNTRKDHGWTDWGMHHADIAADAYWMDSLIKERNRVGCDVLSVVVPIKDDRGLTSCGKYDRDKKNISRLTMHEIYALPETFFTEDLPDGMELCINTGLWVCDFTKPWVEKFPGFRNLDDIIFEDDVYKARTFSEDWNFSLWCADNGVKVGATRKIGVDHWGRKKYSNREPWGTQKIDEGDK